jgi:phage tail sheath protein FI
MPEYLAPGVYVEEVSFRSKSIEGVPTSTTGFAGLAHFGPVVYTDGPKTTEPRLITSFTEYERVYGGLGQLRVNGTDDRECYLAHAARAFFANGGKRLYVSRVFAPTETAPNVFDWGVAFRDVAVTGTTFTATWRARWPGRYGNVHLEARAVRSKNLLVDFGALYPSTDPRSTWGIQATRVKAGAVVEIIPNGQPVPVGNTAVDINQLAVVTVDADGRQTFRRNGADAAVNANDTIQLVDLQVRVTVNSERIDVYDELATDPKQKRYIGHILQAADPEDENAVVWLDWDPAPSGATANEIEFLPARLLLSLQVNTNPRLANGNDGVLPGPDDFMGEPADLDDPDIKATGLEALGEIEDIAIVAVPDGGDLGDEELTRQVADRLITHAETLRYRIAVIDGPLGSSMNEIRDYRGKFDSKYAALYHPWIEILDPTQRPSQGAPQRRIMLPPSGFVTGIYARSDIERGVHKAPANEIVRGLTRFEANINKARQDVLNPEGINALRFFEGRGNRVWGARTISSDPEWKYVNVRRLFIYIEHSIDKGTQWAVFEPNNQRLWANIRQTVEDFLLVLWRDGALLGDKPEDAYFVRCDRTTMTQNDLDNGRLICLIGIAPVKPAEFVIFRIGQWTADVKQ